MGSVWWLVPLGFVVGAYGTLIGAGGGFVLVPILALLYPADSPETLDQHLARGGLLQRPLRICGLRAHGPH